MDSFFYAFHKSLRQVDVFEGEQGGHLDMILYNLVKMNDVVYEVFKKVFVSEENIQKHEVTLRELSEAKAKENK